MGAGNRHAGLVDSRPKAVYIRFSQGAGLPAGIRLIEYLDCIAGSIASPIERFLKPAGNGFVRTEDHNATRL